MSSGELFEALFRVDLRHEVLVRRKGILSTLSPQSKALSPILAGLLVIESRTCGKVSQKQKHTTARIRMWSPTILLTNRRVA